MRLERLTLSPYGQFADRALDFRPEAALHVVLGRNESGKTTTLSAIGDLLFGFPARTTYDFAHDQRLLRVGGLLRLRDGSVLELRRRKGNRNTLVNAADQPLTETALQTALGSIDRKTFEAEFGLTAQALREGGETLLRADGGLAETLAASSAGLNALSRSRERLGAEADALFTTRRSAAKTFYVVLDRYEESDRRLRDSIITPDALKAAEAAALGAGAREIDLKNQYEETDRALARWRRAQRTAGKLARLDALGRELAAFADLPAVAAQTLAEARAALTDDRGLRVELERLAVDEAADQAAIAALAFDPVLLAQGEAIDGLRERLGAVRKAEEDLPRRDEARDAARNLLDDLARRLGLADHLALLASPPTDPEIARARALIAARRRAEEKHGEAALARDRALAERDRLRATPGADAVDPEPLKRRLAAMADVAADADRLRRERATADREARALVEETARLDPSAGDIDALARLALPDETAIVAHLRAEEDAARAHGAAEARLSAARRMVETGEAAFARRAAEGGGATRADWIAARERRAAAFARLGAALDGEAEARREHFEALYSSTLAADVIADSVLADTDRAARLAADSESVSGKREELSRAEAEMTEAEARRVKAANEWRALWASSGLTPLAPGLMGRWRERVAALLARREELNRWRAELDALLPRIVGARASVIGWLGEFGAGAPAHDSFEEAHRAAKAHLEGLQAAWVRSRELDSARKRAEKDAIEAAAVVAREAAAREKHAAEWPAAIAGLRLSGAAGLDEAEAALKVWDSVALPRQAMTDLAHRIETMRDDIASFEAGVAAVSVAAPALAGGKAAETLNRLVAALGEARRARDSRETLQKAVAARAVKRRRVETRREALAATFAAAAETLGVADSGALASTLDRAEKRLALEGERATLRRDLSEIADGLDEAPLRAEQAEMEIALAPGNIELAEQRRAGLLQEIRDAAGVLRDAQSRLETLGQGREAAGSARDRQEAAGELIDIAERWIIKQAAARLATRAIERHRAAAQDPLVTRAGELFANATAGGFAGLATAFDEADRPALVARRSDGEIVKIPGLSEGARDQLFLSLRLALLERRVGEPLPFIGDDILASFDDERTLRALRLLAKYGARRQVIVFTHHRHVAELAHAEGSAIDVVEM